MPRLLCLDGLRGVLAVYVLLGHMAPFMDLPPHWHVLAALLSHGTAGVDMFFILSGLVIAQSLAAMHYRAVPFLIARAARIFPVFLVVFAAAIAVQAVTQMLWPAPFAAMAWIGPDSPARDIWARTWPQDWPAHVLTHLTMTHGLFPAGHLPDAWVSFLGAAWSLSTEWQFYVLMTLVASRARGEGGRGAFWLAALFLGLAALALAWQAAAPPDLRFSRAFLPNKAQYFALGIASGALVRDGGRALLGYALVLAASLLLSALEGGPAKLAAGLAWTLCLAAQLRPDVAPLRPLARLLATRALLWLGAVSYCVYLVNEPVQRLLGAALGVLAGGDGLVFTVLWVPGAILLPIGLAWLLHAWVEVPGLRHGRDLARAALAARSLPARP